MQKYKKVIVRMSILMSIFTFFFLTTTVKGAESNNIYVSVPSVDKIESDILLQNISTDWEKLYYSDFDNLQYLIINKYGKDDSDNIDKTIVEYTRLYFFPRITHPLRDITMQGSTYGKMLRYAPYHDHNCILNGVDNCTYEEHIINPLKGNIWYTTQPLYYFYYEFDYSLKNWGLINTKTTYSQTGISFNMDNCEVLYSNSEIYYYNQQTPYWHNIGTRFIYNEMGIVYKYDELGTIELHYSYNEDDIKNNTYLDEDININLDNGNQFEYEEITDSDDLLETILKHIKNMWKAMLNTINNIRQLPTTIVQGFYDYIGKPIRAIYNILFNFPDTIKAILEYLFIPSDDCMNEFKAIINDKYPFINDIPTVIERMLTPLRYSYNQDAPEFNINIYGTTVNILDLSWLDNKTRLFIRSVIGGLALYRFGEWLLRFIPKLIKGLG